MKFNFLYKLEASLNPGSFWLRSWRPFALLLLFGLIIFSQTMFFDLTYLDDNALILDNAPILSQAKLSDLFANDVFFSGQRYYYRPIMSLSLWLDFKVMQSLPFWYHLTNIFLAVIAASLLFVFLQKLKLKRTWSWWAAVIFLIHPALSAAVAWIPGRNDILLAIFILASFIALVRFWRQSSWWAWIGHAVFLVLAFFTKEIAVLVPAMMLLYLYLFENLRWSGIKKLRTATDYESQETGEALSDLNSESDSELNSSSILNFTAKKLILLVSTWLTVFVVWFLPRQLVLEGSVFKANILWSSLFKSLPAVFLCFGKFVWPLNLSVFPTLADSPWWPGLFILILLITVFGRWSKQRDNRYLIFGITWFLIFLLPSFFNPSPDSSLAFFEHRLYLPFIGLLIALWGIDLSRDLDFKKAGVKISLGLVILLFIVLNLENGHDYRDRFAFWQAAVRTAPHSAFVHSNLGAMYYLSDNLFQAQSEYQKALKLDYKERMTHNNLGLVYTDQKKYSEAEKEFNLELAYNPNYDKALFNLGYLYYLEKRYLEAAYYWQATLIVNPAYYQAYQYLLLAQDKIE